MPFVTERMMSQQGLRHVIEAQAQLSARQSEVAEQRRVRVAWDDPAAAVVADDLRADRSRLEAMRLGGETARVTYQSLQGALEGALQAMQNARVAAIGARNAVLTPDNESLWQGEVDVAAEELLAVANMQLDGRYLFAGTLDDQPPFVAAGTYSGNSVVRLVEVADGTKLPLNIPGSDAFAPAAGTNALAALATMSSDLGALSTALLTGTGQAAAYQSVGDGISRVDAASATLRRQLTMLGAREQRLNAALERRRRDEETLTVAWSATVGTDTVQSATAMRQAESSLQAAARSASILYNNLDRLLAG